ncbi:carboxypeptidase-like regulatory domain-containing protein [Formosa sp. 4Alg 33]|uniref:carboxypeptidase-like regulatory domain-containing protein n=1 Tax=Formosa sp. 4Alg 33 TaxID=3382189 RepID=UPI003D9C2BDE
MEAYLKTKVNNLFRKLKITILFVLIGCATYAQTIELSGQVTDSLNNPLENANLLAIPQSDEVPVGFGITNKAGAYKIKLQSNQSYQLTISYLGYKPLTVALKTSEETKVARNFSLSENIDVLNEVNIAYTPPITVKKDTIIYLTDKFVTGDERKLREVLKKLPGIEVDKAGNVTANGKKVTKVMVENKAFFNGGSKLAVNNIPADAVDKIEILENYSEVAMLKGLEDSDKTAMNITLKEDKKKFVFGEIEAGGGIKERYIVHPTLFYYSPETNVNFIGDVNNTGVKSFTFNDYMEFEGGVSKLLERSGGYSSLKNSDISAFIDTQDYKANTNQFGALNMRQSVSESTDLSAYVIASNSKTETEVLTSNDYLNNDTSFIENRTETNELNNQFLIGKLTLDYEPSFDEDFTYTSFVKLNTTDSDGLILTENPSQNNQIQTLDALDGLQLRQNLSYSHKLSKTHTGTLEANYTFSNDKPFTNWLTDQEILQDILPLEDDEVYNIQQTVRLNTHTFNALAKDYWVLNNFNHLYTSVGVNLAFSDFYSRDLQQLSTGDINSFSNAGFNNDFGYNMLNTYFGLEYKFMIGKVTIKPAAYYQFFFWETGQESERNTHNKAVLLPKFDVKLDINNSETIGFKYTLNAEFPTIKNLATNYILSSFSSVFKGNETLQNEIYHRLVLSYYKFSLFKGLNINANLSYNIKEKTLKYITQLDGIDQYNSLILFNQPEQELMFFGGASKKINKIRYSFDAQLSYSNFYQIVNEETNKNNSKNISGTLGIETLFKAVPNLKVAYKKSANIYMALGDETTFENDNILVELEYDFLDDFIFKTDYNYDLYRNDVAGIKNRFDNLNASLFYQKEDQPWGFEISVSNAFDTKFKQSNSFSSFLISDTKTFILPRIIMFKVVYKL